MKQLSAVYENVLASLSPEGISKTAGRQILTFNAVTLLILPILFIFGVNAYTSHQPLAIVSLSTGVVMAANLYASLNFNHPQRYLTFGVVILSIFYIYLFITGGVNNTASLWYFLYPLVTCSSIGSSRGVFASLAILSPLLYMVVFDRNHPFFSENSPEFVLRFTVVYLLITAVAYVYQRLWERHQNILDRLNDQLEAKVEQRTRDLEAANRQLQKDIANHTATNQELIKNKDMLAKVLDNVPQLIFWKDREGRFMGCNRVFADFVKLSLPNQITGLTDFDLEILSPEQAEFFHKYDKEVIEENKARLNVQQSLPKGNGSKYILDSSKIPLLDENGEPFAVLGIHEDISEKFNLEEALEKRIIALTLPLDSPESVEFINLFNMAEIQALQDQVARATGVACLITSPDGTPITKPSNFSRLCEKLFRQNPAGLSHCISSDAEIGNNTADGPRIRHCLGPGLLNGGARISIGGKHLANWLIGQVRDESTSEENIRRYAEEIGTDADEAARAFHELPFMTLEQFTRVTDCVATITRYLSQLAYQNTQQARLISELKTSRNEQSRLQSQLIQAQKMEAVGRLAGGVAHDFNNMLGVILGNAEMTLGFLNPSPEIKESVNEIISAAGRSCDLTRQLLAFARKQTIIPRVLDLNATIEGMLRMLGRLIGENIDLTWQPYHDSCMVEADPSQIDQIMANLCTNARDSIHGIGEILIYTDRVRLDDEYCVNRDYCTSGDYICIAVSDSGRGMNQNTLDNLFEPFFTTKSVGRGTGLGLATVFGIVQQNNGCIEVETVPGKGSTFKIYLQRCTNCDVAETKTNDQSYLPGDNETILLVEDEHSILKITSKMLEKIGYNVLQSSSPQNALEIYSANRSKIDLLMTDVIMPEMSGRKLVEKILAIDPLLKVLYVSGYTDEIIAKHGVLEEGIQLINKPFTKQALSEKVREVLLPGENGTNRFAAYSERHSPMKSTISV